MHVKVCERAEFSAARLKNICLCLVVFPERSAEYTHRPLAWLQSGSVAD